MNALEIDIIKMEGNFKRKVIWEMLKNTPPQKILPGEGLVHPLGYPAQTRYIF
jgi:hypothetical protein